MGSKISPTKRYTHSIKEVWYDITYKIKDSGVQVSMEWIDNRIKIVR